MLFAVICLSVLLSVSGAPPSEKKPFAPNLERYIGIPLDLTHPLNEASQEWPGTRKFEFTRKTAETSKDGKFYASNDFCMSEHLGTHLDAPYHFNESSWKVGDIRLGHLITPALVMDASAAAAANRDLELGVDFLNAWEAKYGRLPVAVTVIFRFGWAAKYHDRAAYFGTDQNDRTKLSFPGISGPLAEALADRKVIGLGVDTPSVDSGKSKDQAVHRAMAKVNAYNLENVDIQTDQLDNKIFTLVALPAKIAEGTGAPVRIIAFPDVEDTITFSGTNW